MGRQEELGLTWISWRESLPATADWKKPKMSASNDCRPAQPSGRPSMNGRASDGWARVGLLWWGARWRLRLSAGGGERASSSAAKRRAGRMGVFGGLVASRPDAALSLRPVV